MDAQPILKAPISKPFSFASEKACFTPRNCAAFYCAIPCWSSNWAFVSSLIPAPPMALMSSKPCPVSTGCARNCVVRSGLVASPFADHCPRFTGRDSWPGRNRCLRCQAHLCLGQREQRARLRQRPLRQNQTLSRRSRLPPGRQGQHQSRVARWLDEEKKELIWGYGTGVAVSTIADYGAVVLAEYTQPFNEGDITYFRPLYQQLSWPSISIPPIWPPMPPMMRGTSTRRQLVMAASPRFPSNSIARRPLHACLTALLVVPSACRCIQPSSSTTPMAIALSASSVLCSFQRKQARRASMNSSLKAKAVSRMSTGNWAASSG